MGRVLGSEVFSDAVSVCEVSAFFRLCRCGREKMGYEISRAGYRAKYCF